MKHVFKKYGIDTTSLHEVCMNWAQLPPLKILTQMLRNEVESIGSVLSQNKEVGKRKGNGKVRMGRTATIL